MLTPFWGLGLVRGAPEPKAPPLVSWGWWGRSWAPAGPTLKNVALLALRWFLCITVILIRQETGTTRAAFFNFGSLLVLLSCLITNTVIQRSQRRASRAAFFNFGPLLVPVSCLITNTLIQKEPGQGQQSSIFQFWASVGPCLLSYY